MTVKMFLFLFICFFVLFILTDVVSDSDIRDITKLLTPSHLQHFYYSPALGLQKMAVERVEYDARFESPDVRGWRVLEMWRKEKASEATRGKVLQALEESGCRDARRKLAEKWELKGRNLLKGCGMGQWLVLVSPCFRENVVATCKIGSFLCSLDNLLQ